MSVDDSAKQKVLKFLRHHPMGVLSTVDSSGKPWGAAIYYVVDDDLNLYFVTRAETYKYKNLEQSPDVAFTVADSKQQITVQCSGAVSRLSVKEYMNDIFDKLAAIKPRDDSQWHPPLTKIHEGNYIPLKISPSSLQYADFGHKKTGMNANYIEKII